MDYQNLHIVYAIRGSRGVTVNRENAKAMAHWVPLLGVKEVIATTSNSHVTEKDLVTAAEKAVFEEIMDEAGLKYTIYDELPAAIARALDRTRPGDVLLLAGCQGMDHGARICLNQIHRKMPHLEHEKVFRALQNRVAGV